MKEGLIFSVSEFLDLVNEMLGAQDFYVEGEVTEAKYLPSGMFFTIKDKAVEAAMSCYMSPYAYRGAGVAIEAGMELKVGGIASIYKPKGRFSFRVETLELAGAGALRKAYELLKKKLSEEGVFGRKRALPEFISHIGLVTSKSGAVIGDFRKNLAPFGFKISHCDVRVEGAQAARNIIDAIKMFDRRGDIDVLVVIRGGGSAEDLQAFNDEYVVRAVFGSRVPTIVAIGHDRDVPLAQLAADATSSTPTAAAELINASWDRLRNLDQTVQQLLYTYEAVLSSAEADTDAATHRLGIHLTRIASRGRELIQKLIAAADRLGDRLTGAREIVDAAERHLAAVSPERQLRLGYSIVTDESGTVIRSANALFHGQTVITRLARGSFISQVKELISGHGKK